MEGEHDNNCYSTRGAGRRDAKIPGPDHPARRMTLLRIMQQIQSIDAESPRQPLFTSSGRDVWTDAAERSAQAV
jgi:hypothetical protein